MRNDRRLRHGPLLPGAEAATKAAATAVSTGELFAAADRLTARSILLRVGRRAVPLLPRAPLVAVLIAAVLAMPSTIRAQSAVRASATASARVLSSSVRVTDGAVTLARGRDGAAVMIVTLTPPPVARSCDRAAEAPCRMLVVDLP